jgi:multimeric flavodoxin WrbA
MADAVAAGAADKDISQVELRCIDALQATVEDVLWADAMILGTPENFGYMSGALKYFLDRVYYPCLGKVDGLPYALFVRAGNDGSGAVASIDRILSGLSLRQVQDPVLLVGEFDNGRLAECRELGMTIAAGLEAGVF